MSFTDGLTVAVGSSHEKHKVHWVADKLPFSATRGLSLSLTIGYSYPVHYSPSSSDHWHRVDKITHLFYIKMISGYSLDHALANGYNTSKKTYLAMGAGEPCTLHVRAAGSPWPTERTCPMESPSLRVGLTLAWGTGGAEGHLARHACSGIRFQGAAFTVGVWVVVCVLLSNTTSISFSLLVHNILSS